MNTKIVAIALLILLLLPVGLAQEEEQEEDEGFSLFDIFDVISGLVSQIPEKLYSFTLDLLNMPVVFLLNYIKKLLAEPVNIEPLRSLWAIITYVISLFYGLFILFAGLNLMTSGYSAVKRAQAKIWLRDSVLMVIIVQVSYYLYSMILNLSASMTSGVMGLIDDAFFLITMEGPLNIGLGLVLSLIYLFVLVITLMFLGIRYIIVAAGLIFFPLGLFLNFIPPLKSYGKLIINVIMLFVFVPFAQTLVLLTASQLLQIQLFHDFNLVIMVSAFFLADLLLILAVLVAVLKSITAALSSGAGQAVQETVRVLGA